MTDLYYELFSPLAWLVLGAVWFGVGVVAVVRLGGMGGVLLLVGATLSLLAGVMYGIDAVPWLEVTNDLNFNSAFWPAIDSLSLLGYLLEGVGVLFLVLQVLRDRRRLQDLERLGAEPPR